MKKITNAIIILLVIMMTMTACSSSTSAYKYADEWDVEAIAETVDAMDYVEAYAKPEASTDYDGLLGAVKNAIKTTIPHSELLDWEKFEKLQNVYELDISESDVSTMSAEEIVIFSSYIAFYDEDSDSVYILPQFYAATDAQKTYCLIHEVIHSLVPNRSDSDDSMLVEGLVDWLAIQVCSELGLNATASYQESVLCVRMLAEIYGEEEVVRAICEDRIVDLIDGSTEAGMAEKLNISLYIAHGGGGATIEGAKEASNVEMDIISHAAKHEGVNINDWLDAIAQSYEANGIKLDINYFKQ